MKKLILASFIFTIAGSGAYAQFSRGTWMAGGSASGSFSSVKYGSGSFSDSYSSFSASFSPTAGYFVANNFAIGLGIGQTISIQHQSGIPNDTDHEITYSTFARYYYKGFFGQLSGFAGSGNTTINGDGQLQFSNKTYGYNVGAGYAWLIAKNVAVEPFLGYGHTSIQPSNQDAKNVQPSFYLQVGFQVYLHRR